MNAEEKSVYEKFKSIVSNIKAKFSDMPVDPNKPIEEPVKMESEVKIAGTETVLVVAGDPSTATAETPVQVIVKGSGEPAPDGEHKLEDGSVINVTNGGITSYKPAEVAAPVDQGQAVAQAQTALKAEFAAQKVSLAKEIRTEFAAQIAEQNATIKDLNEIVKFLSDVHIKQMETAVSTEPAKKELKTLTPAEVAKLTPAEQVKYNRGKL